MGTVRVPRLHAGAAEPCAGQGVRAERRVDFRVYRRGANSEIGRLSHKR